SRGGRPGNRVARSVILLLTSFMGTRRALPAAARLLKMIVPDWDLTTNIERTNMPYRSSMVAIALAALCIAVGGAQSQNAKDGAALYAPSRYPDWSGPMRWTTTRGGNRYDQYKPAGRGQQAPLTPEYQAIFEAGLKDQAAGGQGANQTYS